MFVEVREKESQNTHFSMYIIVQLNESTVKPSHKLHKCRKTSIVRQFQTWAAVETKQVSLYIMAMLQTVSYMFHPELWRYNAFTSL